MKESIQSGEVEFRVKLLERAMSDTASQISELVQRLTEFEAIAPSPHKSVPQPIVLDADAISPFAAGFHLREIDASGRPFRWTGGDDYFELRFFLDRNTEWTFDMHLMSNANVDLTTLRAFVDYAEVPIQLEASGAHVRGSVPAKHFSNLITITFYLPSNFVPSRLDPNSVDDRSLGVVFYGLRLDPVGSEESADVGTFEAKSSVSRDSQPVEISSNPIRPDPVALQAK